MALGLEKCFFLHSLGCLNFVFILDNLFFAVVFFFFQSHQMQYAYVTPLLEISSVILVAKPYI